MHFAQTMRLIWIDAHAARTGFVRREDICTAFNVSVPLASTDLGVFQKRFAGRLGYDTSRKGYVPLSAVTAFDPALHDPVVAAAAAVRAVLK